MKPRSRSSVCRIGQGQAARIFEAVAATEINIDMIGERVGVSDLANRSPSRCPARTAGPPWPRSVPREEVGFDDVLYDDWSARSRSWASACGLIPASRRGSSPLPRWAWNIEMISTSEIRISVVVDQDDVDRAVAAAHTAFGLDAADEAVVYAGTGR